MPEHTGPAITPPPPLRGSDPGSFAHHTVAVRMPAIGRRVLEENTLAPDTAQAVLALVDELAAGSLRPLDDPGAPDLADWNASVEPHIGQSWLAVPWFLAETYFYRRILAATGYFRPGGGADPFARQKRLGLASMEGDPALAAGRPLALDAALLGALWGNQADMSLWPVGEGGGPGGALLLADATVEAVALIEGLATARGRVDVVLDNAGAELVHDLLLVDALLTRGLRVALHAKAHPTFVSDATEPDVLHTVAWLAARAGPAADAGAALRAALADGRLALRSDWYWTSPLAGWELPAHLAAALAQAGLLISKGDANYRRWLGDRHWPHTTPLSAVLAYAPTATLLLRTCKSEIAVGLDPARIAAAEAQDPQWRTSGRWGLVQLAQGKRQ